MRADIDDNIALENFDRDVSQFESTVIGKLLSTPDIATRLKCTDRDFFNAKHRDIFRLISERVTRGLPVGNSFHVLKSSGLMDRDFDDVWFHRITRSVEVLDDHQAIAESALLRRCSMLRSIHRAISQRNLLNPYADPAELFDELEAIRELEPTADVHDDRKTFWEGRGYAPPIDVKTFLERDFRVEYLIDRCLAKHAACTIAGASKSMKTTFSLYLAICLAAGKPLFGRFNTQKTRVMFASAESGAGVLQRNLRGMAQMMEIDLGELCEDGFLSVQFWVPKVANQDMLDYFGDCIDSVKPGAVVLDPLYLSLNGDSQANLSLNGEQIHALVQTILDRDCTPIVDDHVKRSSGNAKEYKPLQLEDITGAAKSEYFRQWMLLGRRSRFDDTDTNEGTNTRRHDLWLTMGGSAGHSGTWGLDIEETFDKHFEVVEYSMDLRPASDIRNEAKSEQAATQESKAEQKARLADERIQRKADEIVTNLFKGDYTLALGQSDIGARLGVTNAELPKVLARAVDGGKLRLVPKCIKRANKQKYDGYMLAGSLGATSTWDPNGPTTYS